LNLLCVVFQLKVSYIYVLIGPFIFCACTLQAKPPKVERKCRSCNAYVMHDYRNCPNRLFGSRDGVGWEWDEPTFDMFGWESKQNRDIPLNNIPGIFAQTGGELAPEKSADGGVPLRWRQHLHPAAISLSDVILPSLAPVKRSRAVRSARRPSAATEIQRGRAPPQRGAAPT